VTTALAVIEDIIDGSGAAPAIEALLPAGIRPRQLTVRTLLTGMMLALDDRRPAHLTEVHNALTGLPGPGQARLGVTGQWKNGPHQLTYRQVEYTFSLVVQALTKQQPDGAPSANLARACDELLEASIPAAHKNASAALAADWTDVETWSRPPPRGTTACADPEAHWGHRNSNLPGPKGELFFGYYLSAATMVAEENGPAVPELARRMDLSSCAVDPARALAAAAPHARKRHTARRCAGRLRLRLPQRRRPGHPAPPGRRPPGPGPAPADRGPKGTHHGAIIANGNLYCPQTPRPLLDLGPLAPAATAEETAVHDQQTAELARHKLGRITADDADGYHRVACPAVMGKIRCPHRSASMTLDRGRPEILNPPHDPPACCTQQTITVPPQVAAKTRQKHDYPSAAHRRSYNRRTSAERTFATIKDPATTTITRGWCRLTGPTPLALWLACLLTVRNQRILRAFDTRQADNARRAAAGLPPKTRKRRRKTLASLASSPP
jgi:hypothetical protein